MINTRFLIIKKFILYKDKKFRTKFNQLNSNHPLIYQKITNVIMIKMGKLNLLML